MFFMCFNDFFCKCVNMFVCCLSADMDGCSDGGGRCGGGGREELIEAVLTCEGHICDPHLPKKLTCLVHALKHVTHSGK